MAVVVVVKLQPDYATKELIGTGSVRNAAKQLTLTKYGLHSQLKAF
jgi:hypothetical protein